MYVKYIILILLLLSRSFAADFQSQTVKVNSIHVTYIKPIDIRNDSSGFNHFRGGRFLALTISNNDPKGYKIYATAQHGALNTPNQQKRGSTIPYRLDCDQFKTQPQGEIIPAVRNLPLIPGKPVLVYDVTKPSMPTEKAKTHCSMRLENNQTLREKFAGTYQDQIIFSIKAND